MSVFSEQRCFNHAVREAVARCPQCRRFYCRECITEHEDRVLCAACLKGLAQTQIHGRLRLHGIVRLVQVVTGLFIAWMFFYVLGRALVLVPTAFHEGTVWEASGQEKP